jgi:hypothetical protein
VFFVCRRCTVWIAGVDEGRVETVRSGVQRSGGQRRRGVFVHPAAGSLGRLCLAVRDGLQDRRADVSRGRVGQG